MGTIRDLAIGAVIAAILMVAGTFTMVLLFFFGPSVYLTLTSRHPETVAAAAEARPTEGEARLAKRVTELEGELAKLKQQKAAAPAPKPTPTPTPCPTEEFTYPKGDTDGYTYPNGHP